MNKTLKIVLEAVLALVVIGLGIWLYLSISKPVKFDEEYNKRGVACAEKLRAIRVLEEAYKQTYNCYCGNFDTLFGRLLNEDSLRISTKVVFRDKFPQDSNFVLEEISELEAIKLGYIARKDTLVNPIKQLRETGKLPITLADGSVRQMTDEEILNLRFLPYPKGTKEQFEINAGKKETTGGFEVPVVEVKVDIDRLMSDCDHQLVVNKKDKLTSGNKYPGWKFGSMEESIIEGNFE